MVITYSTSRTIKFPVYKIESSNWELADGLLFLEGKLLDDRNMPGETLGIRRIQTPYSKDSLYKLHSAIYSLQGILKQNSKTFVDSNGVPFIYEKTVFSELKYYKIKKVERKEVASLLWLEGVNFPFTIPRPPEEGMLWAGVLHFGGLPWVLYEYSEEKLKDTRRKV